MLPTSCSRNPAPDMAYAIDNGAWYAHTNKLPFDAAGFRVLLQAHGRNADWVSVPDIVAGGHDSIDFSRSWLEEVLAHTQLALICVQDGLEANDLRPLLGARVGLFVGGSTVSDERRRHICALSWKWSTLPMWARLSRETGCYLHVGRVNSKRLIGQCALNGAHSFDGSSASRWGVTIPGLDAARRQGALFVGEQ